MSTTTEVRVADQYGVPLVTLSTLVNLEYAHVLNNVGAFTLTVPGSFDHTFISTDRFVQVWRTIDDFAPYIDFIGFIRRASAQTDAKGVETITIAGPDLLHLLTRRIIAHDEGADQADQSGAADDLMKNYVLLNLGSSASNTARRLSTSYFVVEGKIAQGPVVEITASRQELLATLQQIADMARQAGTEVYFDIVPILPGQFAFQTWINQRGYDRTVPGGVNPVSLGLEYGNLNEPVWEYDWSNEKNVAYCGASGDEFATNGGVVTVTEDTRLYQTLWSRSELWADTGDAVDNDEITHVGRNVLAEHRPRRRFNGRIVETPTTRYGINWGLGDRVSADYRGMQLDGIVRSVKVAINEKGAESIEARIEVDQ